MTKKRNIALGAAGLAMAGTAAVLGAARWAYGYAFSPARDRSRNPYQLPGDRQSEQYRETIFNAVKRMEALSCEKVSILSHDGLKLAGRYYHQKDGAPLMLFFHGYRSPSLRDFSGGFWIYWEQGFNILIVDQRAHGESEGNVITMGIKERHDCVRWVEYCEERFGPSLKIWLGGISMGAATVLMAAELLQDHSSIKGILADCGYSSVEGIMKGVIRNMKLPVEPSWWLLKLGARLYGGFDVTEASALESLKHCSFPVVFIHGREDRLIPFHMSLENRDACASENTVVFLADGAGHGMSFFLDEEGYFDTVVTFIKKVLEESDFSNCA